MCTLVKDRVNQANKFLRKSGVCRFVNFGHRPWKNRGHFCHNAGKNLKKKFPREKIKKKRKKPTVGQKYEINDL